MKAVPRNLAIGALTLLKFRNGKFWARNTLALEQTTFADINPDLICKSFLTYLPRKTLFHDHDGIEHAACVTLRAGWPLMPIGLSAAGFEQSYEDFRFPALQLTRR
ncbi:hypothetical protein ABW19_dt0204958 [Dactylella cylindrospora]|nr:hypothetical protein ABW19_dt0204958 [Dactylella cylindrospora]